MEDAIVNQIEADVKKLEEHCVGTYSIRQRIIDKLSVVVDGMVIDPSTDKASSLEAKMGVVNSLLKVLDDTDSQQMKIVNLKQKIKADDIKEDTLNTISNTVTEFMKRLSPGNLVLPSSSEAQSHEASDAILDGIIDKENISVLEGELEFTSKTAADIIIPETMKD